MQSARQANLELDNGQLVTLQLGGDNQFRGIIPANDVLYRRFTGLYFFGDFNSRNIPPGTSDSGIFVVANADPFFSVSRNIDYGTVNPPLIGLPYSGVPSVYRVLITLNLTFDAQTAPSDEVVVTVNMLDTAGNPVTQRMVTVNPAEGARRIQTVKFYFLERISEVTSVVVTNDTGALLTVSTANTQENSLIVEYLGTL